MTDNSNRLDGSHTPKSNLNLCLPLSFLSLVALGLSKLKLMKGNKSLVPARPRTYPIIIKVSNFLPFSSCLYALVSFRFFFLPIITIMKNVVQNNGYSLKQNNYLCWQTTKDVHSTRFHVQMSFLSNLLQTSTAWSHAIT